MEARDRGVSGVENIRARNEGPKALAYLAVGSALTLGMLWLMGTWDAPKPSRVAAAQSPRPPATAATSEALVAAPAKAEATPSAPSPSEALAADPVPAEPAVPAATTGRLILRSTPTTEVFDGETSLGSTPLDLELDPGPRTLRLVSRSRFIDAKRTVDVRVGETTRRIFKFGLGKIRVRGPDGASVSINGRKVGRIPLRELSVAAGRYRVLVRYKGKKIAQSISMKSGETFTYDVNYRPAE